MLWAEHEICLCCDSSEKIHHFQDGRHHKCETCGRVVRIITGTICSDSPIQIWPKWFLAICQSQGRSSVQLAQSIGVRQPTA